MNCRLVPPGDLAGLEQAVTGVLDDDGRARGARAERSRDGRAPSHVAGTRASSVASSRTLPTALLDDGRAALSVSGARRLGASRATLGRRSTPPRAARRGRADLRALPRVRAAADRRRAPVPARARRRARAPRACRRAQSDLAGTTAVSSTRSTSTSAAFAASRATTCASSTASTARSGRTAGSTTAPTRASPQINAELADATIVQSRYSLDAHRALGIELRRPHLVANTVDPAIFHPPPTREPIGGRRVRVIATSWSDNPNKGADVLAWLDANLDHERFELTFAGRTQRAVRAHPRARRDPDRRARGRAAAKRRLPRAEPQRSVLERAARGARVRAARRLSRERRPPGARRRRGDPVRRARRGSRRARQARRRARRAAGRDPRRRRSPTLQTATSRCSRG